MFFPALYIKSPLIQHRGQLVLTSNPLIRKHLTHLDNNTKTKTFNKKRK